MKILIDVRDYNVSGNFLKNLHCFLENKAGFIDENNKPVDFRYSESRDDVLVIEPVELALEKDEGNE